MLPRLWAVSKTTPRRRHLLLLSPKVDTHFTDPRNRRQVILGQCRVGIAGGLGLNPPPQFLSTDDHFLVKIGFKFQKQGKISPPSQFF